jgi:hypothetical protein
MKPYRWITLIILVGWILALNSRDASSTESSVQMPDKPISYPPLATAETSRLYTVTVNGFPVFTEKYKNLHYTHFSFREKAVICITVNDDIRSHTLSPEDYQIPTVVEGRILSFAIEQPRKLVIGINGNERLMIFADPIEIQPDLNDPKLINLANLGIDNTGQTVETKTIQRAINVLAKNGILYVPPGIYQTGTLSLKNDMTLYLAGGSVLKGSPNPAHYPLDPIGRRLLMISDSNNVTIKGRGILDGNGAAVRSSGEKAHLVTLKNSRHVLIEDIFLRDSASWNTHILFCNSVTVRNIKMINDVALSNTDGFDPDSSCDVLIEDSFIYAGDDAIAVKTSGRGGLLRDLRNNTFQNNVILTQKSALKIGTETKAATMTGIRFVHNHVIQSDRGMAIYCNDGADIRDVQFIGNHFEESYPDAKQRMIDFQISNRGGIGQIRDILIKDCGFTKSFPKNSTIEGLDADHQIGDIVFDNLSIAGILCRDAGQAGIVPGNFAQHIQFRISR